MAAAVFRDFITLMALEADPAQDSAYGAGESWQQYAQVWAQVLPLTGTSAGTEQYTQQGVQSRINYAVTIRYRTDITAEHRIVYRGQPLEILTVVDPDGMRQTLAIQAAAYPGVQ